MANPVEIWKHEKHGFDVWDDLLAHARARTAMKEIPGPDLERMKWYGVFYRKRDAPGAYMLRIRITANELTAVQAKEIARIAYDVGYGIVDITTRANIQVQGLAIENVPRALARLEAVGLSTRQTGHDNVRNVFGHPLAGVDPHELIDARPVCRAITDVFLGNRMLADLPRKFNIAVSGRAGPSIHYWTQDVGLVAAEDAGRVGFVALVGGKQGHEPHLGDPLPVLIEPQDAPAVVRAILELFREQGSREKRDGARFRRLVEKIGVDGVLAEVERRLERSLPTTAARPASPIGYDELVGWFPQRGADCWALGLCPPLGRLSWLQLEAVSLAAQRYASGRLRTTPEQGLMILDVPGAFRDELAFRLAQWNLSYHADSRVRNVVACTGKQFCNIAVTDTKGHALRLIEELRRRSLELHGIRIHMSGCPSACANHHTADIGLKGVRVKRMLGTREGFDVLLGGGVAGRLAVGTPYKTGVDVEQLPQLVDEVVREFYLRRAPGETFSGYWRKKLLGGRPSAVGGDEYRPPIWECEKCGHRHAGEDPPIFCPQCAALRRHFARLEDPSEIATEAHEPSVLDADGYALAADESTVPDGAGVSVSVCGRELALFRVDGEIRAIDAVCPHAGGSLAEGRVEGGAVTCPLHSWRFDLATGAGLAPANACVAAYPTRVRDGKVFVFLGDRSS